MLIKRRWHSRILNVQFFRGAGCNTDHCLVVAEVRERLALINKQHRILMWKDLISVSSISWRLGNSIRLRSQIGLQLWRT